STASMELSFPHEIYEQIFKNFNKRGDIFSSLLVNRKWCRLAVPLLWRSPFSKEFHYAANTHKIIRTYLSCLDEEARKLLSEDGIDMSNSPSGTLFDYVEFLQQLDISELKRNINKCHTNFKRIHDDAITYKLQLMYTELCKLFMKKCKSIYALYEVYDDQGWFVDPIPIRSFSIPLPSLPGADRCLKYLKRFDSAENSKNGIVYRELSQMCNEIVALSVKIGSYNEGITLPELVASQKHLKSFHLSSFNSSNICVWFNDDCFGPTFRSLASQKNTLTEVLISGITFRDIDLSCLDTLGECKELRSFGLLRCEALSERHLEVLSNSFQNLESFTFIAGQEIIPARGITGFLKTANANMKKISFDVVVPGAIKVITDHCENVESLSVCTRQPEEIFMIFQNCRHLKLLLYDLEIGFISDELLTKLSEYVPKSLKTLSFYVNLVYPWTFSSESLKIFLDGCKKSAQLEFFSLESANSPYFWYEEEEGMDRIAEEHFRVLQESGIKNYKLSGYNIDLGSQNMHFCLL
ncbi:8970_t:CDS:1, partial [Acaulospora morrowiae]